MAKVDGKPFHLGESLLLSLNSSYVRDLVGPGVPGNALFRTQYRSGMLTALNKLAPRGPRTTWETCVRLNPRFYALMIIAASFYHRDLLLAMEDDEIETVPGEFLYPRIASEVAHCCSWIVTERHDLLRLVLEAAGPAQYLQDLLGATKQLGIGQATANPVGIKLSLSYCCKFVASLGRYARPATYLFTSKPASV